MLVITGRADAGAFLARLVRLDPLAVVRLRAGARGAAQLWARLPFGVLVTRWVAAVAGAGAGGGAGADVDLTVAADALLARLGRSDAVPGSDPGSSGVPTAGLPRRDGDWRWSLPPSAGRTVETVPAARVAEIARAAGRVLRSAEGEGGAGRAAGTRAVRDALLDHVPIVVTLDDIDLEIPQRLVQGLTRMGFLSVIGRENPVMICCSGSWIGLAGAYGAAWYQPISPLRVR